MQFCQSKVSKLRRAMIQRNLLYLIEEIFYALKDYHLI